MQSFIFPEDLCRLPLVNVIRVSNMGVEIQIEECVFSALHIYLPTSNERLYQIGITAPNEQQLIWAVAALSQALGIENYRLKLVGEYESAETSIHTWTAKCSCRPQPRSHRILGNDRVDEVYRTYELGPRLRELSDRLLCLDDVRDPEQMLLLRENCKDEYSEADFLLCRLAVDMVRSEVPKVLEIRRRGNH